MKLTAERLYVGLVTLALLILTVYNLATVPNRDMIQDMETRLESNGYLERLDGDTYVYTHYTDELTDNELYAIERLRGYYQVLVVTNTIEDFSSIPLTNE